jgi:hypothetical protein
MAEQVAILQVRLAALEVQPTAQTGSLEKSTSPSHGQMPHVVVDNDRVDNDRLAAARKSDC